MKHSITFCVGLAALGVAVAAPAQAQTVYAAPPAGEPVIHPGLPPSEILVIARASGLRPLTQPARRGPNWVLLASDNMGGQLRVVISAQNGRIVHASPAYDPRFAYEPARPRGIVPVAPPQHAAVPPPAHGAPPPADLRTPTPPPPRTARPAPQTPPPAAAPQNPSLASAPDTTGAIPPRPARTPLPRPRPAIEASGAGAGATPPTPPTQARPMVVPETSPEADVPSAGAPAPSAAPAAPVTTQLVPVAPLD